MRAPAPFSARHRADLERDATKLRLAHWAAEGCRVSRLMLDTGLRFPEALEELGRRMTAPAPVPDETNAEGVSSHPDTEWR
jgi:hypothetical protein